MIITHIFSNIDIIDPRFGGSRVINEQVRFLKRKRVDVKVLSLENIGSLASIYYKFLNQLRRKKPAIMVKKSNVLFKIFHWYITVVTLLLGEIITQFDIFFKHKLKRLLKKMSPSVIFHHTPFGCIPFIRITQSLRIPLVVVSHNIECIFFLQINPYTRKIPLAKKLLNIIGRIEFSCYKRATHVIFLSSIDRKLAVNLGVPREKTSSLVPIDINRKHSIRKEQTIPSEKKKLQVGFVGSESYANVLTVMYLCKLAKKLPPNIEFMIFGSVAEVFKSVKIPQNVILKGYVKDLYKDLATCDVFINNKFLPNTGIEAKMLDYIVFNKPIITTPRGARGFRRFKNVIVVNSLKEIEKLLLDLYARKVESKNK